MSADNQNSESESRTAVLLVGLSVFGVVLGYALSIAAARILGPNAFEDYAVAVATLGMLSAAAEAGVGKFALKVIPEYTASRKWGLASGYWRFNLREAVYSGITFSANFPTPASAAADNMPRVATATA